MGSDAGALHCPNCGGPAGPGDAACRYCRAALATVSCPTCFALMFDGAVYCPGCGARRSRTAGSDRHAPCPSCYGTTRGTMQDVQVGDTAMLECRKCHAVWIDAATFEHICANAEAQAAVLHQWPGSARASAASEHVGGSLAKPSKQNEVRYRRCVACGTIMNRLNFGRLSGTIVDVCRGHGTFLDAGELHGIVRFMQGGGLDRARQRQIEDLKDQEQRLRQAQSMRADGKVWRETSLSGPDLRAILDSLRRNSS